MTRNRYSSKGTNHPLSQAYKEKCNRYSLTPEEEKALTLRYRETNDLEAEHQLILGNLRLVVWIILDLKKEFLRKKREFPEEILMDLIQEGNLGLILAVKDFDPYRGVKLSSYASFRIKRFVRNFIKKEGIRIDSMDAPLEDDSEKSLHDIFPAAGPLPDEALEALEDAKHMQIFCQKLDAFRQTVNPKELDILGTRILADQAGTLQEIADRHEITYARVRQIEDRLTSNLRNYLQSQFPNGVV